ncbi:MAG: hypothetical protein AAFY15_09900 [Cyanobacteria bacterium J06648_11]
MFETDSIHFWTFNLEGTLLGFIGEAPDKMQTIVLEVAREQMAIRVSKQLRNFARNCWLQPGDRIRCIGRSQLDLKEKVISLSAYHISPIEALPLFP